MAFIALAQTLLIVVLQTSLDNPAYLAAWWAGACPKFAWITDPIRTSFTNPGATPAFAKAPLIAIAPNWVALKPFNEPPKLPIGVRTAEIIYTSFI